MPAPLAPGKTEAEPFENAAGKAFTVSKEEMQRREAEWQKAQGKKSQPRRRCLLSNSARLCGMSDELSRNLRAIHDLERAIRVWELVRDRTQQVEMETTANCERQGEAVETNPTVAKARVHIARCNLAILRARERIDKLVNAV